MFWYARIAELVASEARTAVSAMLCLNDSDENGDEDDITVAKVDEDGCCNQQNDGDVKTFCRHVLG
jgi:hypothetical protein